VGWWGWHGGGEGFGIKCPSNFLGLPDYLPVEEMEGKE